MDTVENGDIVSSCWRCGECCRSLVKGIKVTQKEWEVLEEHIDELGLDPVTIQESKASVIMGVFGAFPR